MSTNCSKYVPIAKDKDTLRMMQDGVRIAEFPKINKENFSIKSSVTFGRNVPETAPKELFKTIHQIDYKTFDPKYLEKDTKIIEERARELREIHYKLGYDSNKYLETTNNEVYKSPTKEDLIENKKSIKPIGSSGTMSSGALYTKLGVEEWKQIAKKSMYKTDFDGDFENKPVIAVPPPIEPPLVQNARNKTKSYLCLGREECEKITTYTDVHGSILKHKQDPATQAQSKEDILNAKKLLLASNITFGSPAVDTKSLLQTSYSIDFAKPKKVEIDKETVKKNIQLTRDSSVILGSEKNEKQFESVYKGSFRDVKFT